MPFANLQKLYEWAKVQRYAIKTGKYKDAGAEYREMTPDERALLQRMLDNVLSQFKEAVSTGRDLPMDEVTQVADGRIFSGEQAKALHLVDELGSLQDAIQAAGSLAQIKGKPKVIYPERKRRTLLDFVFEDPTGYEEESEAHYSQGDTLSRIFQGVESWIQGRAQTPSRPLTLEPGLYWLWQ
jgi:protease-4